MAIPGGGAGTASGSRPVAQAYVVGSATTDGQLIAVAATSSPGTTIHTVPSDMKTNYQCVEVWGCNIEASANRTIVLQPGATGTKDQIIRVLAARRGMIRITPRGGIKMTRGAVMKAWASAASVVNVYVSVFEPEKFAP